MVNTEWEGMFPPAIGFKVSRNELLTAYLPYCNRKEII